ncbi:TIGR03943 family putative permease subunit [Bacillus inaquosorum]|uniref:TIGR03943 family putative permease subunit n=1 Tax=Bacillus inaquosorum TaxID=483913 RepID=UPI00227E9B50|nr:TIGR03943 family protein [Bacillus inaquosorum]MCY7766486.1 TIGR03943 family protein [Bacillus inaquosorum]
MSELKENKTYSFDAVVRGLLLIGFALMVLKLYLTGHILHFISPRMLLFTKFFIVAAFALGILSFIWRKQDSPHACCACASSQTSSASHPWLYSFFLIPIVSGFLFPNHVLTKEVAQNRIFSANSTMSPEEKKSDTQTQSSDEAGAAAVLPSGYEKDLARELERKNVIPISDKYYVPIINLLLENAGDYAEKEIDMKGFVYFDEQLDHYIVGRFGISCCIADATVYGLPVAFSEKTGVKEGEWVHITGRLAVFQKNGEQLPIVSVTHTKKINTPKSPYVYEIIEDLTPK